MANLGFTFLVREGDIDAQCMGFIEECMRRGLRGVIACKASKYEALLKRLARLDSQNSDPMLVLPIDSEADFTFFLNHIQLWHLDDLRELHYLVDKKLLTLPMPVRVVNLMASW